MIEEIITWCNSNNGFATILLSALTLLVSIIAIIVSIRTARLPYTFPMQRDMWYRKPTSWTLFLIPQVQSERTFRRWQA